MPRETIILDLLTGNPQGLRAAKFIQSWTGQAFAAPRMELKELLAKKEMESPGIYILYGESNKNELLAYIGIGKSVRKRLSSRKEEFWTQAIVFVGTEGSLHEGHVKFLEGKVIEAARKIGRYRVTNDQGSGSPLPEYEIAAMEVFYEKMQILLPVLGCNLLVPFVRPAKSKNLVCKIKGLIAQGQRSPQGFVVFKGSQAIAELRPSAKRRGGWIINLRKKLEDSKVLVADSGYLVFTKDFEFASPSAAAAVIRGGNANGLTAWRSENGETLKDLEAATIFEAFDE